MFYGGGSYDSGYSSFLVGGKTTSIRFFPPPKNPSSGRRELELLVVFFGGGGIVNLCEGGGVTRYFLKVTFFVRKGVIPLKKSPN